MLGCRYANPKTLSSIPCGAELNTALVGRIRSVYKEGFRLSLFVTALIEPTAGEEVDGCEKNESLWRQNPIKRCPEKSPVVLSLMLGVYLIVTNILLVNLLIAMFR